MVHHWQVETLEIRNISRNMEGVYLARTLRQLFVTAEKPFRNKAALPRPVAVTNNIVIRMEFFDDMWQAKNSLLFVWRESGDALQLADKLV
jgi:hypothetical protein